MRRDILVGLVVASSFVSAAVLPASTLLTRPRNVARTSLEPLPEITARATLESRQTPVNSICGYWSANGSSERHEPALSPGKLTQLQRPLLAAKQTCLVCSVASTKGRRSDTAPMGLHL
jgi:hypothetical protein